MAGLGLSERHWGVPSAQEQIQAGSVSLSEMQRLHLEKIEELTLYAIQAQKQFEVQAAQLKAQAQDLQDLHHRDKALVETNQALAQRLETLERQMADFLKVMPPAAR